MKHPSLHEQVTAEICRVTHPHPTPQQDREHCQEATKATTAVLRALAHQIRQTTTTIPTPSDSEPRAYEYWRGYRDSVVELAETFETLAGTTSTAVDR